MFYFSNAILTAYNQRGGKAVQPQEKEITAPGAVANFLRFKCCRRYNVSPRSAFLAKAGKNKPQTSIKQTKPLKGIFFCNLTALRLTVGYVPAFLSSHSGLNQKY